MTDTPPEPVRFNPNDMTIGEAIWFEDAAGMSLDKAFGPDASKARAMRGMIYVALKRADPAATVGDADAVKITDAGNVFIVEDTPPSPPGGD